MTVTIPIVAADGTKSTVTLAAPNVVTTGGFVSASAGNLMLNGASYRFVGSNNIDMLGWYTGKEQTAAQINAYFSLFPANTVHRTYAAQEYGGGSTNTPGYDQFAIVEAAAAAHNQLLVVDLSSAVGGTPASYTTAWYTSGWEGTDPAHSWGAPPYGSHTTNFTGWIATLCGAFKNSTSILAWSIMNEPQGVGQSTTVMANFFSGAASHIRAADPNHLVTWGWNGAYNQGYCTSIANIETLNSAMDLLMVHEYSTAYENGEPVGAAVSECAAAAKSLNKPYFIGEAGVGLLNGSVTLATRISTMQTKYSVYFGKTQNSYCPNPFTWPASGVIYWDLSLSNANGGTVTNKAFCDDPQTGGAGSMAAMIASYL